MRHKPSEKRATLAANYIKNHINLEALPKIGLILGTGWGDYIKLTEEQEIPFQNIPGFKGLETLEGHARKVVYGKLGGVPVIALRGRVHLNERPADPTIAEMVRLQTEMLMKLGVNKLILTCAAGSLAKRAEVGEVVVIDGFVTLYAPEMPLYAGEFISPEDMLDEQLSSVALNVANRKGLDLNIKHGGHVMLRGPFFESRKYDKRILGDLGPTVVGMSVLPEACIAALYYDVKVLALAFVTNDDKEEHSHEENQNRVKEKSEALGEYLSNIVSKIS